MPPWRSGRGPAVMGPGTCARIDHVLFRGGNAYGLVTRILSQLRKRRRSHGIERDAHRVGVIAAAA
jgi:hypothetical protein